jgi:alpha-beta hydrolase superfamily lysophospholipase
MKEHVWISSRGKRLSAMLHLPAFVKPDTPVVICCHGFTGDKIGANQLTLNLAKKLVKAGYGALRFDFLGSGDSEGDFAMDTIVAGWQEDLNNVVGWIKQQPQFAAAPILLYGHSLGGLIVLTHKAADQDIAGRIVFAPVLNPIMNFRDIILGPEMWKKSLAGETIANFFAKGFSLQPQFVKDLVDQDYNPIDAATKLVTPLLIIHGLEDLAVPIAGSEALYQKYAGPKMMQKPQLDHVATGNIDVLPQLIEAWLSQQFTLQ